MATSIVGITGGIGAGKSVVSRILRCRGFEVFDCDFEAKSLMSVDVDLIEVLTSLIGSELYQEGHLNKSLLASVIFTDGEMRKKVNHLVHSAVRRRFVECSKRASGPFFVEAAIMGSSGLVNFCTEVWVVDAPENLRFERAIERGGISHEDLRKRMMTQDSEIEILENSGVPLKKIDNGMGSQELLSQIDFLMKTLI